MRTIRALATLVARRATATPGLLAIRVVGMLVAVALVVGVSLYSAAMGDAMLRARLDTEAANATLAVSATGTPLTGARYAALDRYIRQGEPSDLAVPLRTLYAHHTTSQAPVFRVGARGMGIAGTQVAPLALEYYEGLRGQIKMVSGTVDAPARLPDGDAPVLISRYTARTLRLHVGDRIAYIAYAAFQDRPRALAPPLVVAGVFVPRDIESSVWGTNAGNPAYRSLVAPHLDTFQRFAARGSIFDPEYVWLQETDLTAIHLDDASALLDRLDRVRSKLASLAPGTDLLAALGLGITGFLYQYGLLPYVLLILVLPIVALILYAVAVTTALALDQQAGEIVLMRSRGATRAQVFALYACEGLALAIVSVLVAPLLGLPLGRLIGHASGFLSFGGGLPFDPRIVPRTYLYAGATALLCLLAGLLPAMDVARRSMASFKGDRARPRGRPLWQRLFLDLVALAIALYGLAVLARQGPVTAGAATAAVAQDPLIALAPLLFAVAVALLIGRVLPWVASLGLRLLGRFSSPSMHVALQGVARAPRQPMRLVQLCTLTLTLGIVAATVAGVEARNLSDQQLYQAGSTVRLSETFDRAHAPPRLKNEPDALPLSAHLALPGVRAATPALRYESFGNIVNMTDNGTTVNVLGIDPATAGRVMWFRPDFADQPLSHVLAGLASPGPNAVVSDSFLSATGLRRGDAFGVILTNNARVSFRVADVAHYFPTLDPRDAPFVVANLAYLTRESKGHGPNEVWMDTDRNQASVDRLIAATRAWPRQIRSDVGLPAVTTAGDDPLTAGIYGVVSVGFLIAVGLTALGFVTYAYLTLRQRLAEFAIVRALGLSQGQVRSLVLFEQAFLLGAAILGGIAAGLLTTRLFLPYLPIAANTMPPFLVIMPWVAVAGFVLAMLLVFLLTLGVHVSLLLRLQLGRVLRLGEG